MICGICSETALFKLLLNQLPIKHDSWHIRQIRTILCFAVFCYGYVLNNFMHIFHDYVITVTSNGHDGVSNHQPRHCLFIRLFRRRSKKTSKLRVTGLCAGNSPWPVNSPHKWPVTLKMFPLMTSSWWQVNIFSGAIDATRVCVIASVSVMRPQEMPSNL